uniref:Aminotransferase class I/classII large domain-containing protein n=1 Tax=Leersia perrieri TaxID=77586 RepID=A0A0D9WF38_9ORYZ
MGFQLFPAGAAPSPSLSHVATSAAHGEDSPYFAGWKAYNEDPYDAVTNPDGVIQMGLAENQVSLDLLEDYLREHPEVAGSWVAGDSFRDNALFQDYHGLDAFRNPRRTTVADLDDVDVDVATAAGRVHVVYSLSKDLGLPGFRVGVVHSRNDAVVAAARRMSSFTLVSSQTQRTLAAVLSDEAFVDAYVRANRERLRARREHVVAVLARAGVPCLRGNAGLFVWMDMRRLLGVDGEATFAGELRLWDMMLREVKINISPGSSCHCSEPGWFRVCFANMSLATLDVALERIGRFMDKWSNATVGKINYLQPNRHEVNFSAN